MICIKPYEPIGKRPADRVGERSAQSTDHLPAVLEACLARTLQRTIRRSPPHKSGFIAVDRQTSP
jgi:hypothetical protein